MKNENLDSGVYLYSEETEENKFLEYLDKTSLLEKHKLAIKSIFDYLKGNHPSIFANRIFLLEGEPGIGKTFLAKKLLSSIDKPKIFLGQTQIEDKVRKVKDLKELLAVLENLEEGIVYIDDLKYIFNFTELEDLSNQDRQKFMKLLENFRDNNKKTILILTLNDSGFMDDSWKDRIDAHIILDLPSNENKLSFLENNFSKYSYKEGLKYLSENSIGYNYRDLPNVLKIAYFSNMNGINVNSIKEALSKYTPSSLSNYNIKQGIKIKLQDLLLKEELSKELNKLMVTFRKREELLKNKVSKNNFFIFEGPAGVGKTYTAFALAGELEIPLVKISAKEVYGRRFGLEIVFNQIKRFQNAIVLIDDADKILDGDAFSMNDGSVINSEINAYLDSLDKAALVIFSVNDSQRLGRALRDRFKVIKFENPSFKQRESYFIKNIKDSSVKFDLSYEDFAEITDGMNYREIQRFWNECIFYALENNLDILDKNHISSLINNPNLNNKIRSNMIG